MPRYPEAAWYPSPHFSERGPYEVRLYVEHISGEGTFEGMRSWFENPDSRVSAHFGVARERRVDQYVDTTFAAWHAGIVNKPDTHTALIPGVNPNRYSIGIEYEGVPGEPLTEGQIEEAVKLHRWLDTVHPLFKIDRAHVVGHYQINSVDRPNDPGTAFPWDRLLEGIMKQLTDQERADAINALDTSWGIAQLLKSLKSEYGQQLEDATGTLKRLLGLS